MSDPTHHHIVNAIERSAIGGVTHLLDASRIRPSSDDIASLLAAIREFWLLELDDALDRARCYAEAEIIWRSSWPIERASEAAARLGYLRSA